jgi:hypothetical protein
MTFFGHLATFFAEFITGLRTEDSAHCESTLP